MVTKRKLVATAAVLAVAVTACSSSKKSTSSSASNSSSSAVSASSTVPAGSKGTYTVGVLTDLTGLAASGNKTCPQGVTAGAALAANSGYTIKSVVGDTATSPATALSAAQKMVQQDHVLAVIACSSLTFAAADYLKAQGVPVIGVAEDGPEWSTNTNMFSVFGALDGTKVNTATGDFFKMQGATVIGALGYGISPQSANAAKAAGISAQNAGLKAGYIDANLQFGSTNVQPVALAMKSAGVDGVVSETDPNTSFALITALRQAGANLKVALLPTGYGGDLLQAGPGALQAGQGVYFSLSWEPIEMKTAATKQFQSALTTAGVTGEPTYAEYAGYTSVALLIDGLKGAGSNATSSSLLTALDGVKNFDAAGLLGDHSFAPGERTSTPIGPGGCLYMTKLAGSGFELVPNADPICGTVIPGKSVS